MKEYIQIGKIVNTQGIKGEVKVLPLTDDITRFEDLDMIYIEDQEREFEIERVWYKKNFVVLKFKGINNINDVLEYKNKVILIPEEDAIKLEEDTFFIHQIIGLVMYTDKGEKLGIVKDVLQLKSNDVYVVKNEKKEHLIPATKEVVKEIDLEGNKIIIEPLEGMIE